MPLPHSIPVMVGTRRFVLDVAIREVGTAVVVNPTVGGAVFEGFIPTVSSGTGQVITSQTLANAGTFTTYTPTVEVTGVVPVAPSDLAVEVVSGDAVLTWTDNSDDETAFHVYRRNVTLNTAFLYLNATAADIETYTDTGPFTEDHSYQWLLYAFNASGLSDPTAAVQATPNSTGLFSNEPAGFTEIIEDGITSLPGAPNWVLGNNWDGRMSIVQDIQAPVSGPNVMQFKFKDGLEAGVGGGGFYYNGDFAQEYEEFYCSIHVKLVGSDWEAPPVQQKLWYVYFAGTDPGTYKDGFLGLNPGQAAGTLVTSMSQKFSTQYVDAENYYQQFGSNYQVGDWAQIETYLKHGDLDTENGLLKVWVDDVLVIDRDDVLTRTTALPRGFYDWEFATVYGGTGYTKTRDDYMWLDHVYLSGKGSI